MITQTVAKPSVASEQARGEPNAESNLSLGDLLQKGGNEAAQGTEHQITGAEEPWEHEDASAMLI